MPLACANVRVSRSGDSSGVGRLTLDRPECINALTPEMVACLTSHLEAWAHDDAVCAVIIDGAGSRGLCAGGDIRLVRASARANDGVVEAFWAQEYVMNAMIAEYTKPVIAFMPGIVMGGGVGLASHAKFRVVCESTKLAMPEVTIGIIPDVGGTYLLSRAREYGTYLALTGATIGAADAIVLGLADAFVPSADLVNLTDAILGANDFSDHGLTTAIERFVVPAGAGKLEAHDDLIARAFAHDTVEAILADLDCEVDAFAEETAARIRGNAPTALKLTLRALRAVRANGDGLRAALARELRLMMQLLRDPDLPEGIRAAIVDKDHTPVWNPARLADVDDAALDRYFAK